MGVLCVVSFVHHVCYMIFSHLIPTRSKISSRRTQTRGPVPMRSAVSDSLHCSSDTTPTTSRNWPREEREKRRRGTRRAPKPRQWSTSSPPIPSTQSPPSLNQISILPQPNPHPHTLPTSPPPSTPTSHTPPCTFPHPLPPL